MTLNPSDRGRSAHSWIQRADLRNIQQQVGTPVFIYSESQLASNIERIRSAAREAGLHDRVELYVPFFPNSNPHLLAPLRSLDVGLLLQLPNEYAILERYQFNKFIISPGHVSDDEIDFWSHTPYPVFLASLDEVGHALQASSRTISVRIDSLGSDKPGIKLGQLDTLVAQLRSHDREVECFEVYCGSGNTLQAMIEVMDQVLDIFQRYFPTARSVNFAGGHGFVYEGWSESEKHFAWRPYFEALRALLAKHHIADHVKFLFEPARDVLADVGALMLGIKRDLVATTVSHLLVTDGSRMLMPSAQLRNRKHNLLFWDEQFRSIDLGGPCIEAAVRGRSILRNDYVLPGQYQVPLQVGAGCYVTIMDAGAYCATQHMEFLNIPPAAEVSIDRAGVAHLVSRRGDQLDKWRNLLTEKRALDVAVA